MGKSSKRIFTFLTAITSVIFASLVSVTGALAWFASQRAANTAAGSFSVFATSSEIVEINLIKFDYALLPYQSVDGGLNYDYLNPAKGKVSRYDYYTEHNSFGYVEDEEFHPVDLMNLYDPLELLISGQTLKGMNTNALLEVRLKTSMTTNVDVALRSTIFDISNYDPAKDLRSSDCMDFDLFLENEITDALFPDKSYYPSYIDEETELNELEKIYYRTSHLSAEQGEHANYYGTNPKPSSVEVGSKTPELHDGFITAYININYAPEVLKRYETEIRLKNILVCYDYYFVFDVKTKAVEP